MTRPLPPSPDLEFEKKQAKALLRAFRAGDAAARARVREHVPRLNDATDAQLAVAKPALSDAQLVVARERGFASWTKLKQHIEAQLPLATHAERFLAAVREARATSAKRLLAKHPAVAQFSIHTAACVGDADFVAEMLQRDPALAKTTHGPNSWTPLLFLCSSPLQPKTATSARGFVRCAEQLLDAGADPNSFTLFDEGDSNSKLSALYRACVGNQVGVVRLLLERGADPNDGESVYHSAELNRVECLEALLAHGVELSARHPHWDNTPLYFLAGCKEHDPNATTATEGMRWLLEHGADPNVTSYAVAETPLHRIVANGRRADVAEMFLAHGADPNLPRADGRTAHALAVRAGNFGVAELLRTRGAATDGVTPVDDLLGACMRADEAAARATLAAHPRLLDDFTPEDRGAIADAAHESRLDSVGVMAKIGFDLKWEGTWGGTPLHHAAWRGNLALVKLLLDLGAPVNVRDGRFGCSPIAWAAHGSQFNPNPDAHCAIVDALIDAGSVRSASINNAGEPPESMAHRRVAARLRARGFVSA